MRRERLLRLLALPIVGILLASWSFSLALQGGWLRRSLAARVAATFGRPVEVAHFGFSILGGPKIEADSVTVGEDPRFGQEYFLRADRLTASLRWTALLRGRLEFNRLSLSRPSLNLVRSADGQWNVETWLPPPNLGPSLSLNRAQAGVSARASRIDIESGRINFKKGTEKLSFALVDVAGSLNRQSAGRWLLDLQAHPMRAAVFLQRSGTLRLRGTLGGTSARLQPADLRLSWEGASLADAARLARGTDFGLRGLLDADFTARIEHREDYATGSAWKLEGGLRLQAIHRWNLVARPDNPAFNVKLTAVWRPAESRIEMQRWLVEAPHSNVNGEGSLDWSHGFAPQFRVLDSEIGFPDVMDWTRAFLPGRAENLVAIGGAKLEAKFGGWPLHIEDLSMNSDGASVRSGDKLAPIQIGAIQAVWSRSSLVLAPFVVRISSPSSRAPRRNQSPVPNGVFHVEGALGPIRTGDAFNDWPYRLTISGQTSRLQDLRAVAAALGWEYESNWKIEGPASLQLVCAGALRRGASSVRGRFDLHDLRITNGAISEPILVSTARVDFSPGERAVEIADAEALGAHWRGGLQRKMASTPWIFDLSADRLDIRELGREIVQSRQGLLYRLLPFAESAGLAPQTEAAIARINAEGHLHIDELALGALPLGNLEGKTDLQSGALTLRQAQADFYGGRLSGEFRAQLGTELRYNFRGQVDRADLSVLAALTSIRDSFEGIGSGQMELAAHGLGWQALLASLKGEGFLHVQDATIDLLELPFGSQDGGFRDIAGSRYRSSTVSFRVQDGQVRVDPWLLSGRQRQLEIVGNIDFSRRLDLQVRSIPTAQRLGPISDSLAGDDVWVIGGTLDAPQIIREEQVSAGNQTIPRASGR